MIKPINNYVQIEPIEHEEFVSSQKTTYDEIGIVTDVADGINQVKTGDKVYFDSWMAAKFPRGDGTYYWLVPFDNIKAKDEQIPTEQLSGGIPSQVPDSTITSSGVGGEV